MIPLHKDDYLRLTPYAATGDLTTYIIKPASMFERQQFESELASPPYNAGIFYDWHVHEAVDDFIATSLTGNVKAAAQEAVIAVRNDNADAEQLALSDTVIEKATEYSKPYQALLARRARRATYLPYLATKMFLVGWESREHEFSAEYGRVTDKALNTLSQSDLTIIGLTAFRFINLDDAEKKAFISELSFTADPPTLPVDEPAPTAAAGASVKKTTRKIRSST